MNLKKIGNVVTSKFVETGPSFYKKRIYRAAVSQRLRNTALEDWNLPKQRCGNPKGVLYEHWIRKGEDFSNLTEHKTT